MQRKNVNHHKRKVIIVSMKIVSLESQNIRIPLERPKKFATKHVAFRDYTIVKIRTEDGIEGWSFVWGIPAVNEVIKMVSDLVVGEQACATMRIWNKIFGFIDRWGRGGIGMRALSGIDMALWDLLGKYANLPVHKMLGGAREECPSYYSGGYYPDDCTSKQDLFRFLEQDMGKAVDMGFSAFKMKVGAASVNVDLERIGVVREVIGPDAQLMLDANCGYDVDTIIAMARKFEKYDITWIEEPVKVDDLPGCAYVAKNITTPVAMGENHYTRWPFRDMIERGCCRYIQADATLMGGFTEYINVVGLAATYDIKLAPHCFHDMHIQLALARPEIVILEYMDAASDVINIQKVLQNPVPAQKGMIRAPEGPGHGLLLDEAAMKKYLHG